ncbi:uncharacterized protein FA14DRAFT_162483 [Meira miltonrushii]|uniref:DUF1996 domain-containing protein n=1 Tax=Meira miltonrushii TaxID=1280837 RepID=A0A316V743_9BASI|nr:uncharacterized protein FA14DRAFT_162483 [Meira miltonrushii]PWN32321.1 hypothetical protein FA14DRAFT_162483 [Meira miltonrushii]
MVGIVNLIIPALLAAATVHASPTPLEKRIVGSLECSVTKTGTLSLVNTKTNERRYASFKTHYYLANETNGHVPSEDQSWAKEPLLTSYPDLNKDLAKFDFLACTETRQPGFENFPPSKDGVFYGHLSPVPAKATKGNPPKCATHRSLYADTDFLSASDCYYSDDSGSPFSYFTYTPGKSGEINFIGYTGPQGGEPETADQKQAAYDFTPGSSKSEPAVFVHDGSKQFSDWVLRLE